VVRMEEKRNAYRVLVWKPVGKRPLGRPSRRWENSIKVAIKGQGSSGSREGQSGWLL